MYFKYGSSNIPHFDKRDRGGEDAWLAKQDILAVADGVGSWANKGIDPGLFSKQLVSNIEYIHDLNSSIPL